MSELVKVLREIQNTLKAPKNQTNTFGKYKYRSCEDILEAVKPLIPEGVVLVVSDEMINLGERYYIKATATLANGTDTVIPAFGWARESLDKKGMDDSQITGSTSSYARKYALNGLFLIDDTKDDDATNDHQPKPLQPKKVEPVKNEDYEKYRLDIPKAETVELLTKVFGEAWEAAKGDKPAREGFKKLYDERKKQLEETK